VISVNTGRGRDADWAGKLRRTAIDKRPEGRGLDWDHIAPAVLERAAASP
jgi:hypothetical protein